MSGNRLQHDERDAESVNMYYQNTLFEVFIKMLIAAAYELVEGMGRPGGNQCCRFVIKDVYSGVMTPRLS